MYENSIKSSSNELSGKPSLYDPLCKLFFEQRFRDFMSLKQRENFWIMKLETLAPLGLNQDLN